MSDENNFPNPPKSKFTCPVGNNIPWYQGFEYKDCPLNENARDYGQCKHCKLNVLKFNSKNKKDIQVVEKKPKEAIPTIGKTYVSE